MVLSIKINKGSRETIINQTQPVSRKRGFHFSSPCPSPCDRFPCRPLCCFPDTPWFRALAWESNHTSTRMQQRVSWSSAQLKSHLPWSPPPMKKKKIRLMGGSARGQRQYCKVYNWVTGVGGGWLMKMLFEACREEKRDWILDRVVGWPEIGRDWDSDNVRWDNKREKGKHWFLAPPLSGCGFPVPSRCAHPYAGTRVNHLSPVTKS